MGPSFITGAWLMGRVGAYGVQAPTAAVSALLERQAQRAREQFLRADGCLPPEDARRLVAARIMGAIYRDLLTRIAAREYDVFSERVRVPRFRKARLAIATWMRTMAFSPDSRARAVASMMRSLAWCGTSQSMASAVMPLAVSASCATSASTRTANLNTACPSIRSNGRPLTAPLATKPGTQSISRYAPSACR